jgi:hypothetical protein
MNNQEQTLPLRLATFTFDPLQEDPDLPEEMRAEAAPEGPRPFLVQLRKPLTHDERARIQGHFRCTVWSLMDTIAMRTGSQRRLVLTRAPSLLQ